MDIWNFCSDTTLYFLSALFFIAGIIVWTQINAGSNQSASSKGSRQVATSVLIMGGFIIIFFVLGRSYGFNKVCKYT